MKKQDQRNESTETKKTPRGQRLLSLLYAGAAVGTTVAIVALARPKLPIGFGE